MDDLDALLADLQSSIPSSNYHFFPSTRTELTQRNFNGTSGYGSLRNKPTLIHDSSTEAQVIKNSLNSHHSEDVSHLNNTSAVTSHSYQYQNASSIADKSHPSSMAVYYNNSSNLSELDSLLLDLSNARYNNYSDKHNEDSFMIQNGKHAHYNPAREVNICNTLKGRPAVDTLLNEMDTTSIYALPNGASFDQESLVPSRQVIITLREEKTEKLGYTPKSGQCISKKEAPTNLYCSSATKELDDLMASLSDIKISSSSHHHQTVTDYAKPNKGISHTTQILSETSTIVEEGQSDQLDSMLGNLQANMSRQGVNTVQKGCCNACEKPIVGQVITALGKTWHPEHFTCNHCNQELGTRNFFERDGYAYCESDYHNLFSPRCAYCNGAILDKCVTALEKTWHTEHFFCAQCGQQFGEDGFHERDGKPYCRNDYFEMFAPKCNGCNRAIMENYISALNSQWHPDCFVCRDCRQPFQGGSFFDHEGLPYCEMHYHAKRGSLCAGCSKPITGRCITAMFKKFHPEHFVCAFCLKQLNKGTFKEQNDKPYCHTCFDKIFG